MFVSHLANVIEPMRKLLPKRTTFEGSEEAKTSFCEVKKQLDSGRMISMLDSSLPVVVSTVESAYGLGTVLLQEDRSIFRTLSIAEDR